jgi:hypothetical protein
MEGRRHCTRGRWYIYAAIECEIVIGFEMRGSCRLELSVRATTAALSVRAITVGTERAVIRNGTVIERRELSQVVAN